MLATRATPEHFSARSQAVAPDAVWHEAARLIVVDRRADPPREGHVVVASGGTADIPVAEEAATCAEVMGCRSRASSTWASPGVHRAARPHRHCCARARVIIAVAGMEGALPSLVAGLVDVPVVAVPTSVGYGANFGGVAALLTMLNSCAGGIGVVNIDNGFGAGRARRAHQPAAWRRLRSTTRRRAEDVVTHAVIAYLDCSTGVSGDKFLGALLDVGDGERRRSPPSTCARSSPRSRPRRASTSSASARTASAQ